MCAVRDYFGGHQQIIGDDILSPNRGLVAENVKWDTKRHRVGVSNGCAVN